MVYRNRHISTKKERETVTAASRKLVLSVLPFNAVYAKRMKTLITQIMNHSRILQFVLHPQADGCASNIAYESRTALIVV